MIRTDFAELLKFPFFWQQTEYVLGGGSSHYMFLVLAVQKFLEKKHNQSKRPNHLCGRFGLFL